MNATPRRLRSPRDATIPRVILTLQWSTKVGREAARGVFAYAREHTDWRLAPLQPSFSVEQVHAIQGDAVIGQSFGEEYVQIAHRLGLSMVVLASGSRLAPCVLVDDEAVGRMAADHLHGLGLNRFGYVWQSDWLEFVHHRGAGFAAGLADHGHAGELVESFVSDAQLRRTDAERRLQAWLVSLDKPCGIFAANDILAAEVIAAAHRADLRVPEDLAVVGVDDDELANAFSEVPLSSVIQPSYQMGYEGARLLDRELSRGGVTPLQRPKTLRLPPAGVVARASSDLVAEADPQVSAALRLIREHAGEAIDVAWIVQQLPVTRRTLERRFKAQVGRTPLEQIRRVRLANAKELLLQTDLPVEVVARRSGLGNGRAMADLFRQFEQITPSALRRQHRSRS